MASTIEGLHNLTGYVKSRDLAVPASFPYVPLEPQHPAFIPRPLPQLQELAVATVAAGVSANPPSGQQDPQSSIQRVVEESHEETREPEIIE